MVRQVIVLPDWQQEEVHREGAQENASIGEPSTAGVAVLHELAQQHVKRKHSDQRKGPEEQKVPDGRLPREYGQPGETVEEDEVASESLKRGGTQGHVGLHPAAVVVTLRNEGKEQDDRAIAPEEYPGEKCPVTPSIILVLLDLLLELLNLFLGVSIDFVNLFLCAQ